MAISTSLSAMEFRRRVRGRRRGGAAGATACPLPPIRRIGDTLPPRDPRSAASPTAPASVSPAPRSRCINSTTVHAVTGDSGEFRVTGIPAGTSVFNVRRLGFEAASFTAVLKSGKTHRATFTLTAIRARAADGRGRRHGDARRIGSISSSGGRADRAGRSSRAPTSSERARAAATDIVRTVPGVRLVPVARRSGNQVLMTRGAGANRAFRRCSSTAAVQRHARRLHRRRHRGARGLRRHLGDSARARQEREGHLRRDRRVDTDPRKARSAE